MIVTNATQDILTEFYGKRPDVSMKAIVALDDGRPLGVSGFKLDNNRMVMFSDISNELRMRKDFKRIVIKAYKLLLTMIPNCLVYATASTDIKGSCVLLKHLGFNKLGGNIWLQQPSR